MIPWRVTPEHDRIRRDRFRRGPRNPKYTRPRALPLPMLLSQPISGIKVRPDTVSGRKHVHELVMPAARKEWLGSLALHN